MPGITLGDAEEKSEAEARVPTSPAPVQLWEETKEKESTLTGCLQTTWSQRRWSGKAPELYGREIP